MRLRRVSIKPKARPVLGVTLVSPQLMNAYLLGQQVPEVWNFGLFTIAKDQRADRDNDQVEVVRHDALEARLDKA
jgi:hypothetical protein